MASNNAITQKLIEALEGLTKGIESLSKGIKDGGPGGAGGIGGSGSGIGGGATPPRDSPASDFWKKAASAAGFGSSAIQQALSGAGASGAASVVGGLAAGGPLGGAAAAIGEVASAAMSERTGRLGRISETMNAGFHEFASGPTSDTRKMRELRRSKAEVLKIYDRADADEKPSGSPQLDEIAGRGRAYSRVQIQQELDDTLSPQQRALEMTSRQLAPLAQAGGFKDKDGEGYRLADQFYKMNLEIQTNSQQFQNWARVRDQRMQAAASGVQGAHQHQ